MSKQTTEIQDKGKTGGCCCADKDQHRVERIDQTMQSNELPLHRLAVKGATCGGCVGKIERALQSVAGVGETQMNLSTGIAIVSGNVTKESLISALDKVGFSATKVE